jgi:hypothetical protein
VIAMRAVATQTDVIAREGEGFAEVGLIEGESALAVSVHGRLGM